MNDTATVATPAKVLVFAGHDPTGGAGIQADIEAIHAAGAFPLTIITALTAQNTRTVATIAPVDPRLIERQFALLADDTKFDACKIGLLPTLEVSSTIAKLVRGLTDVPIVVDPVLRSSTGTPFNALGLLDSYRREWLPLCTVITPNTEEALALTGIESDVESAGQFLGELGAEYALITDGDASTGASETACRHQLYHRGVRERDYEQPRLTGRYHGSGCTLAAAIAARLARGEHIDAAIAFALTFTHETLVRAHAIGSAQLHPNRLMRIHVERR